MKGVLHMKGNEFIGEVVRAEMPDREQMREASVRLGSEAASGGVANRKWYSAKWLVPAAACLALAAVVFAAPGLLDTLTPGRPAGEIAVAKQETVDGREPAFAVLEKDLDIYYINDAGELVNDIYIIRYADEDVFAKWAQLNNIQGVTLVKCVYDNNGVEIWHGSPDDPNTVVEYRVGDRTDLTLTLSGEFAAYADGAEGQLLIESLKKTFYDFHYFDTFELIIETSK
jgi:hypothetical protein